MTNIEAATFVGCMKVRSFGTHLVFGVLAASAFFVSGCDAKEERCKRVEPRAPFSEVVDDLPDGLSFCESKFTAEFPASGEPPADGMTPNRAQVRWPKGKPHDAFLFAIEHFEAKGWKRADQNNELLTITFKKGAHTLKVGGIHDPSGNLPSVVNTPESFSNLEVQKKPCDKPGRGGGVCDGKARVRCYGGWPVEVEDCGAEQRCIVKGGQSKCVPKRK